MHSNQETWKNILFTISVFVPAAVFVGIMRAMQEGAIQSPRPLLAALGAIAVALWCWWFIPYIYQRRFAYMNAVIGLALTVLLIWTDVTVEPEPVAMVLYAGALAMIGLNYLPALAVILSIVRENRKRRHEG